MIWLGIFGILLFMVGILLRDGNVVRPIYKNLGIFMHRASIGIFFLLIIISVISEFFR